MFDPKNPRGRLTQKGSVSFNKHIMRRRLSVANRRASDKIGNREILRRLSGSFTAPKLKLVTLLLRDFVLPL